MNKMLLTSWLFSSTLSGYAVVIWHQLSLGSGVENSGKNSFEHKDIQKKELSTSVEKENLRDIGESIENRTIFYKVSRVFQLFKQE